MKLLIVGSGGREHALAWRLAQNQWVHKIYVCPGNVGTGIEKGCINLELETNPIEYCRDLARFASEEEIDLTIVGPEQPLADGIVDCFQSNRLRIFGPTRNAAMLESSKVFAKNFMKKYKIPTADYRAFEKDNMHEARKYIHCQNFPLVVKADGLAAGKGVIICHDEQQAAKALDDMFVNNIFGTAGDSLVVEEFLAGKELSVFAIVSRNGNYVTLGTAKDHKKIGCNDTGKNTGGMGAYSPAPFANENLMRRIEQDIIEKTLHGMLAEGTPFSGCLYLGLMITDSGPKMLEYNVRFGDPETQALLSVAEQNLYMLLFEAAEGTLNPDLYRQRTSKSACCVVIASEGYPDEYKKGFPIKGIEKTDAIEGVKVFHAGTKISNGQIVTDGGRILGVTGIGKNLEQAIERAYQGVQEIEFHDKYYRPDIGRKSEACRYG